MKHLPKTLIMIGFAILSYAVYGASSDDEKGKKEVLSLRLKGFVQTIGYAGIPGTNNYTNQFLLRRARLDVRIKGGQYLEGRLQGDLASNRLMDAYIVIKPLKFAKVAIGQFKYPLSRERAQSVPSLFFNDFSYTAQVAPNRDLGIRISGTFLSGAFSYQAAVVNGSADGGCPSTEMSDAKDVTGRLEFKPFPHKIEGLFLGIGGSFGMKHEEKTGSITTPGRTQVFAYKNNVTTDGEGLRFAPFFAYYGGRLSMIGEYISSQQRRAYEGNSLILNNQAASLSLSVALAGGERRSSGFINKNSFDLSDGCWGGCELVMRVHGFYADPNAFPTFASAASSVSRVITAEAGINWFLFDNSGLKLTYSQSHFKDGADGGDRSPERLLTLTANLAF